MQGLTRLLLTKIPLFREVIVMSFECSHCQYTNNEIQTGAEVQEQGVRYTVSVTTLDVREREAKRNK